jgi:putative hydrolase of the HAD superfamily
VTAIRFITFDLDDTLWDNSSVIRHAVTTLDTWLDEHAPRYRSAMTPDRLQEIRAQVVAEQPGTAHDVSALREAVLYRGMMHTGLPAAEARRLAAEAFEVFLAARQEVVFFEHALETLERLSGEYALAALTNGNADVSRIGIDHFFAFALSSADVAASKPAPDIFHAALERAGVDPHQSIHVGDHPVDDIHGASSVGMHTIWFKHPRHDGADVPSPPTAVVESLRQLPDAIRRIQSSA